MTSHPKWNLLQPRFSPDGRWVIFHTTNAPTVRQIYAVPAVTGRPIAFDEWIPIVTDYGVHPSWSADGHAVCITSRFATAPSVLGCSGWIPKRCDRWVRRA